MPPLALVEPEDPLGAKHLSGQLIVEEVLEFAQGKGTVGRKRQRGVALYRGVVGMGGVLMAVPVLMFVLVMVFMLVLAVAMVVIVVVIAGAVVFRLGAGQLLGHDLVAFKQAHTQQQG